jgi:hypothetical protein
MDLLLTIIFNSYFALPALQNFYLASRGNASLGKTVQASLRFASCRDIAVRLTGKQGNSGKNGGKKPWSIVES